ncbi:MAG: hypothetical protein V1905_03765 [bacterium]
MPSNKELVLPLVEEIELTIQKLQATWAMIEKARVGADAEVTEKLRGIHEASVKQLEEQKKQLMDIIGNIK